MANVVVTLKIMPTSPEIRLKEIEARAKEKITQFEGEVGRVEQVPIAFGLKSLNIMFIMDEAKGSTEELEKEIQHIDGVNSVDVIDVRRTVG